MCVTWVLTVASLEEQRGGDLGVGEPVRDELEHLELALGQLGELGRRAGAGWRPAHEVLDQATGDRRGEQRVAGRDDPDGVGELLRPDVLEQEAARARPSSPRRRTRRGRSVVSTSTRELGVAPDRRRRVASSPSMLWHADVHQHDVRTEPSAPAPTASSPSSASPTTSMSVCGLEDQAEAAAHERLVVGDEHADHGRHASSGRRARTLKPPSGSRSGVELAVVERDPLAHADEPVPAAAVGARRARRR